MKTKDTGSVYRRRPLLVILLILSLAILVRIVYINQLGDNPFFDYPIVDSDSYDVMATKIAEGENPTEGPFFQPPLYPYFLGILYNLFGHNLFTIRFLQMLLGVVNVLLAYLLAKRIFGPGVAVAVGVALSIYGTMLFFEGELLAPALIIFLNLLLILSLLWSLDKPAWWRALLSGLVLGASAIAMAVILPFALVVLVYGLLRLRRRKEPVGWRRMLVMGLCFLLGIMAVIFPVTLRNLQEGDDLVLISSNAGINFFIGSGKDFDQKVGIRPGYEWQALLQEPIEAGYKKPSEQSAYFVDKGMKIIAKDPLGYLAVLGKKLSLFAHGNEIMRNQELYPFREYSSLLSILVWKWGLAFPYGLLFPLAVVGAVFALARKKEGSWLILLFSASHILVIILFFVCARYRMNILPFLVILAVYGVFALVSLFRERRWLRAAISCGLLTVLLVACNWNVGEMATEFNADAYYNLGVKYMEEGRPEAKAMYEKAVALLPDYPEANGNLGIYLDQEGDHLGAIACFQVVLERYPDDVEANLNLGIAKFGLGDIEGAREQFLMVLALDGDNQLAQNNLAVVERVVREREALALNPKIGELLAKLQAEPNNPALLTNLGAAYLDVEYYELALKPLQAAVAIAPGLFQAHNNLGIVLAELGDTFGARREFETALMMDPENESVKLNLEKLGEKKIIEE